ncbi:MAG: thiamine-phosphate pyrophosphorylase [Psychromonas sp.]|jgi:thiamine-phosphate pyrophosphorylase
MLILISSEERITNESKLVNEVMGFDSDLIFHLRKPTWDYLEARQFLLEIKDEFLSRIVLHQHHFLMDDFKVKGLHLNSSKRKEKSSSKNIISTSFHNLESAINEGMEYEYFFCSPLFKSISKPGYEAQVKWDITSCKSEFKSKAIALGGINDENLTLAHKMGFSNFATLGFVWKSSDPIASYKKLHQSWLNSDLIA